MFFFCGGLGGFGRLLSLPRGRGPSQTPKFLSPGPPSPWLPALSPVNKQEPLVVQVPSLAQARGCKGRSPLHKKTKNLPLSRRGRGLGGWGQNQSRGGRRQARQATPADSGTARSADDQPGKSPITPAPHIPPAGRRQCGQNPAGRRDSRRTRARPRRRKWRAERYREHG